MTRISPPRISALGIGFAATLVMLSCRSNSSSAQCRVDPDCGSGAACLMGVCLPVRTVGSLSIEVAPRQDTNTESSAVTEFPEVPIGATPLTLTADPKVIVRGTVIDTQGTTSDGHVVALTKSNIAGHSDLQSETDMAGSAFDLAIGRSLLTRETILWVFPNAKVLTQPPVPFETQWQEVLPITFPRSEELLSLGGRLIGPLDDPFVGFSARAKIGNSVISNIAKTDMNGRFELKIAPKAVLPGTENNIVVELEPPSTDSVSPRFVSTPMSIPATNSQLPGAAGSVFRMPDFGTPGPLAFTVRARDGGTAAVANVTVRVRTEIPMQPGGTAIYARESATNDMGEVQVSLLPGMAGQARYYQVAASPPADSPYSTKCLPQVAVTLVGSDTAPPQFSETIFLDRKATLRGSVFANNGLPAFGVRLTATQLQASSQGISTCREVASPVPVATTSLRTGAFSIMVEPGTYRLDLDPPDGSPFPRLTLDGDDAVVVTADRTYDVTLPAGEFVEGYVYGMDQGPLSAATVRFFDPVSPCGATPCMGAAGNGFILRAQARADLQGRFRAVLPRTQ